MFWRRFYGDTDRLAIQCDLLPDPDEGRGATPEQSASWGTLRVWVRGVCLTAHSSPGEGLSEGLSWYLLPLVEWFIVNWDALLHEERTPQPLETPMAAEAAWLTSGWAGFEDPAATDAWWAWWQRHDLFAARDGGFVPEMVVRRWRDQVEISWHNRAVAGVSSDVQFLAAMGGARLRVLDVAPVLWQFLQDTTEEWVRRVPNSTIFRRLRVQLARLRKPEHRRLRQSLLVGAADASVSYDQLLDTLLQHVDQSVISLLAEPETAAIHAPVEGSTLVADLARSLETRWLEHDLAALMRRATPSTQTERTLIPPAPLDERPEWAQGYDLAERLCEELNLSRTAPPDLDRIVRRLRISVAQVALRSGVRGASLYSVGITPQIYVNVGAEVRYNRTIPSQRFTLAKQLCHLLFDRSEGGRVASASGRWLAPDLTRRANAFAAYLLMPPQAVRQAFAEAGGEVDGALRMVAERFDTSLTATLNHLWNLRLISLEDRDGIAELIGARPATLVNAGE